jgi:hypothetical protein
MYHLPLAPHLFNGRFLANIGTPSHRYPDCKLKEKTDLPGIAGSTTSAPNPNNDKNKVNFSDPADKKVHELPRALTRSSKIPVKKQTNYRKSSEEVQ